MRINVEQHPDTKLLRIQNNVNRALAMLGFDFMQEITITGTGRSIPGSVIAHTMPKQARGMWITYLLNKSDGTGPTLGAYADWEPNANGVKIRAISGIDDTKMYEIRFMVYS